MMSTAIERRRTRCRSPPGRGRICVPRGSGSAGRCRTWPAALRIRSAVPRSTGSGTARELPGNAYALGFLRTYASALGLDPNEIARRFKAEAATVNQKTELTFPVPVPERGVPAGAVVLLGVVLAVGAYAGWYRLSGEGRLPAETSTAGAVRLAPLAEQACRRPLRRRPPAADRHWPPAPAGCVGARRHRRRCQPAEAAPPVPAISPSSAAAAPVTRRRAGCRSRAVGPVPHRAAGERRRLGAGAGPRRPGAAEPHPAPRRDLAGAAQAESAADHR